MIHSFEEYAIDSIDLIERNMFERYTDVQVFAANETVLNTSQWSRPSAEGNGIVRAMNRYMELYEMYTVMIAVDLQGNVIATNSVDNQGRSLNNSWIYKQNFKNAGWFQDVIKQNFLRGDKTDGTVVEDVHEDELVKHIEGGSGLAIGFSAPIKDQSGKPIGVWTNRVSAALLNHTLEDIYRNLESADYETAELTLLDKNGAIIVDLDPSSHDGKVEANQDPSVVMNLNLAEKGVGAAVEAIAGRHGAMLSNHARKGISQVSGYAHTHGAMGYPGLGWSMLIRIAESEAMGSFRALNRDKAIIASLSVIFAIVFAWNLANKITRPILAVMGDIKKSVDSSRDASNALSSGAQILADGSTKQAANVEETSSSAEELNAMTDQNTQHVGNALNEVETATRIVSTANEKLKELSQAMAEISSASDETKNIIKTIDEIAFQTNILALNAAVEAARAGEAGAGFAIVADEVRNLAARAAQAAQSTSQLLDQNIQKIEQGTQSLDDTNRGFVELRESTERVSQLMHEIDEASRQQAVGFTQINVAVTQINEVTQQNASSAEEVASASKELDARASDIAESVATLNNLISGSSSQPEAQPKPGASFPQPASNSRLHQEDLVLFN